MFIETFAGNRERLGMIAEDGVPGGGLETYRETIVHTGGCACMGCGGLSNKGLTGGSDDQPSDTVIGGVGTTTGSGSVGSRRRFNSLPTGVVVVKVTTSLVVVPRGLIATKRA